MTTGQERETNDSHAPRAASAQTPSGQHLSGPLDAIHAFQTTHDEHLPDRLPDDPFPLLNDWIEYAKRERVQPNPTAISLATASDNGMPNVRIVLCRGVNIEQGSIWFFTNGQSVKGEDIAANPRAAVAFHWDALDRQARVRGMVEPLPAADSDAYFNQRRWEKRVGAWASDQSRPVKSREALEAKLIETLERFGIAPKNPPPSDAEMDIPRPPHWGGFRILATEVELWVGSPARMHDRARWTREEPGTGWSSTRLQP